MNTTLSPATLSPSPGAASLAGMQVLVIDDDPFVHELLGSMLAKLGIQRVSRAADGQAGVAALAAGRQPDLVICDLHMPGKDGFQVMEDMAARGYEGAVLLLSGMEQRVLNSAALMGRFHHLHLLGVLQKPVSRQVLGELLGKVRLKGTV
ncbi:MAG: response regulator [Gammaproteobacteria bacterium]